MPAARLASTVVTPLHLPGVRLAGNSVGHAPGPESGEASRSTPTYYAGPENQVAASAVRRVLALPLHEDTAERPDRVTASPLVLIGPSGSGKSLLADGIAAAWRTRFGEEAILMLTGVDLRRRVDEALAREQSLSGAVAAITERLSAVRLLVVEDLEGLAPSTAATRLLARLADLLPSRGGLVVASASRPLGEIEGFDARLVSRFVSGLTVEVAAPAQAARGELLKAALSSSGRRINDEAAAEIAADLPADARRVLAAAHELAERFGRRRPIGRPEAEAYLADRNPAGSSPPLADIVSVVARYYSLPVRTLRSSSRKAPIVLARAVAIYFARQLTPLSYDEIGRYLGGRDHTTVLHNHRRIEAGLKKDRALRSAIEDLTRLIEAR